MAGESCGQHAQRQHPYGCPRDRHPDAAVFTGCGQLCVELVERDTRSKLGWQQHERIEHADREHRESQCESADDAEPRTRSTCATLPSQQCDAECSGGNRHANVHDRQHQADEACQRSCQHTDQRSDARADGDAELAGFGDGEQHELSHADAERRSRDSRDGCEGRPSASVEGECEPADVYRDHGCSQPDESASQSRSLIGVRVRKSHCHALKLLSRQHRVVSLEDDRHRGGAEPHTLARMLQLRALCALMHNPPAAEVLQPY